MFTTKSICLQQCGGNFPIKKYCELEALYTIILVLKRNEEVFINIINVDIKQLNTTANPYPILEVLRFYEQIQDIVKAFL